ncbi:MAG: outer membrane protein assembly factor BamD [Calditrichaeota bacterium]|nr:MAG: outer membrane protein assembly factor BamD [Calditrichota bacterium]MBL1203799.1 outer membrane protein assembly factor BamD [Calditrichota bacterium]NOG43629.1 outer membrane protein assembly factor BamD [Calditrichota bacterium]
MKYLLSLTALALIIFACSSKLTEQEYYNKAKEAYSAQKFDIAVNNFKAIAENYQQGKHHSESLFMLGFIYANDLKNLDEAKKYYTEFVTKYPKHDLADDAKYEIETLGKDINELPIFQNATADSVVETPAN